MTNLFTACGRVARLGRPAALASIGGALLLAAGLLAGPAPAAAQSVTLVGPTGSGLFGTAVTVLNNGNFVVTDPGYDNGSVLDVGAVYLYNGSTNALISTLTGSKASDQVGSSGVTALTNGGYVVRSPFWDNGAATDAGAVTWGSSTAGVSGAVSATNSLVGSTANDQVGSGGVTALASGSYVVRSLLWDNGTATDAGAVTWGSGTAGVKGGVSAANSLVGSTASDAVGNALIILTNGNYVVHTVNWDNGTVTNAGAVTWGSGTAGVRGVVSATNSLVGSTASDQLGNQGVTALANGSYVVSSYHWDNGTVTDVGAATWGSGTAGVSGTVSAANSLVGSTAGDVVGIGGVIALTNGHYVVRSYIWDNGAVASAGAVTWGSGTTGVSGPVSTANSLVGSKANDQVGNSGVTALTNGHYVVSSSLWDNGTVTDAGAATWVNGTAGVSGVVSATNSLVGSTASDNVGSGGVTALTNDNYVVRSYRWDNGAVTDAGAATWGSGTAGVSGVVSSANSLVGSTASDQVGYSVTALTNGNYVVSSTRWDNGTVTDAGAATWGSGTAGVSGPVSPANSLVGSTAGDAVGSSNIFILTNGNYVVSSYRWDNGAMTDAGAATWGSGTTGVSGPVSPANSLVGSTASDQVSNGNGITAQPNGRYVVRSISWDNGAVVNTGAFTLGEGTGGTTGAITGCNSIVGSVANKGSSLVAAYNTTTDQLLVGLPSENKVVMGVGAPAAPTGAASQAFAAGATVANLAATGTAVQWYAAATSGSPLAGTTPLATGTAYYATQTVGGCESQSRLAVTATVTASVTLSSVSPASELPGQVVTLTGAGFTSASTVSFGGTAASVAFVSATSLTATVPASLAAGSAPVSVTTGGSTTATQLFAVLAVYDGGTVGTCAAAVPATTSSNDGAWHYLLSSGGQVVAAYAYTGASLGNLAMDVLRADPAQPVRQDAHQHAYLDRNFHLTNSTGRFDGHTVALRLYGLTTEQARLQAADPTATLANLKATQYSGANEDCALANNVATGERRTLAAPASAPAGAPWFVAQLSVADHFSEFYLTGSTAPLPVALTAFTATAEGPAAVRLAWATASETNSARFEVERSANGTAFERLGTVAAAGSSTSPRSYGFVDAQLPGTTLLYYRLRQVDRDGTAAYAPVRTVTVGKKALAEAGLALFPNPAIAGAATLTGAAPGTAVTVTDALGRRVASAPADASGTAALTLPAGLPSGVYVVRAGSQALRLTVE